MAGQHIAPCAFYVDLAATTAIDLLATYGRAARHLIVITAGGGTLNLKYRHGPNAHDNQSHTVSDGQEFVAFIERIEADSDVTLVRVGF